MGCINSSVLEAQPQLNYDLQFKTLIKKKIISNPFYSLTEEKFSEVIANESYSDMNIILDTLNAKLKLNQLEFYISKDVLSFAKSQLVGVYPDDKQYDYHIVMTLYYFLSKESQSKERAKEKFLQLLIQSTIKEDKGDISFYLTGKLSFLLHSILQFCLFSFVYFFVAISLLEIERFENDDLNQLLIERKKTNKIEPSELGNFIKEKLIKVNKNITPHNVISTFLKETLKPISNIILSNINSEEVAISSSQIKEVLLSLCQFLNVTNYLNRFIIL